MLRLIATVALSVTLSAAAPAADEPAAQPALSAALQKSVEELRHAHGEWRVATEFLNPDGTVARAVEGTYRFAWVVPDRVLSGESEIPELQIKSGILFYVKERKGEIEMVSVGQDGHLWVMTGPAGGDTRMTPVTPQADGSTVQLRFTRFNVTPERFESKMDISPDGGKTWRPGNHQVFARAK
jgi:hypothetical protein